jgi:hypothetical protein
MGCDVHGYIEFRQSGRMWWGIIEIDVIVGRNYDMFGSLFGVRNYANFKPLFADRGCPKDASITVEEQKKNWGDGAHGWSYMTFTDILDFELSLGDLSGLDDRVHELRITDDNDLIDTSKAGHSSQLEKWGVYEVLSGVEPVPPAAISDNAPDAVTLEDRVFARLPLTRKEVYSDEWKFVFKMMKTIAKEYGNDNVRLIVWFDN